MTEQQFEEVTKEAKRRFTIYVDMDTYATHRERELRKEDFLTYWIAVAAYDLGHSEGLISTI